MTRAEILDKAKECVCGQREQDYGKPEDNFATIAELWGTYKDAEFSAEDVAVMMALMKIARIKTGTSTDDCFVDLAGYAACGGEIASADKKKANKHNDAIASRLYGLKSLNDAAKSRARWGGVCTGTPIRVTCDTFEEVSAIVAEVNQTIKSKGRITVQELRAIATLKCNILRERLHGCYIPNDFGWDSGIFHKYAIECDGEKHTLILPSPTSLNKKEDN